MHLQVCGREEKGGNTRARSPRRGVVWRGNGRGRTTCAWIVHRNRAQSLAGPRPPFIFDRDRASRLRDAVTLGRSSLYIRAAATEIATKSIAKKTPTHLGFAASAAASPRLFYPVRWRASTIRRAGLQNRRPQWSYTGRGRIRFLGSDLHDCSLTSSSSSPRLVYLFVGLARRVIAFNVNFIRPIAVFIQLSSSRNHKSRTVPALKSCLTYLICWSA
jgi:hypothetical protein